MLGDFPRAWSLLLEFIENSALSKNNEVLHLFFSYFQHKLNFYKNMSKEYRVNIFYSCLGISSCLKIFSRDIVSS